MVQTHRFLDRKDDQDSASTCTYSRHAAGSGQTNAECDGVFHAGAADPVVRLTRPVRPSRYD
jgi:hypothetical protein